MKFAEFKPGMVIHAGPVVVTEADIVNFSRQYDPRWIHSDAKRAAEGRWSGLIASGWHTCALAMRMVVDAVLHDAEPFGSPGLGQVCWRVPVRPGDRLRLEAHVQGVRLSSSREDLGIVNWAWVVFNQHDETVLELDVTSLFDLVEPDASN